jgi:hypothetical protein
MRMVARLVLFAVAVGAASCTRPQVAPKDQMVGKWQHQDTGEVMEFFKDGTATAYYPKPKEAQELVGTYTFVADDRVKVEYKGRDPYIATVAIVGDEMTLTFADGRTGKYKRLP